MMTFKQFLELTLNGKRVSTPRQSAVQTYHPGARFPDDWTLLHKLGIPLFDLTDDDLERLLQGRRVRPKRLQGYP